MASLPAGYRAEVEALREREYPMIQDSVYLDHAGSTLCAKSLMDRFASEMTSVLYGNPHSASPSSQNSSATIEDVRLNLLTFFGADPAEYDLVFVQNATAGVKLVVDALRALPEGWYYAYHQACHTSLIGAREEASMSVCLDDEMMQSWLGGESPFHDSPLPQPPTTLLSYSAQSHMNGKRYPLSWCKTLKEAQRNSGQQFLTLLDVSSLCATSRLDLSDLDTAPDFVVLSLYKIFGFPDLGALIVRRPAESIFYTRRYFGGGTVDMVVCGRENWHAHKSQFLHERLEDGTLPFHNIVALGIAMDVHKTLFTSMDVVSAHTSSLTCYLYSELQSLQHANGEVVCDLYTEDPNNSTTLGTGAVVSFNLKNSMGAWVSLHDFEKLATLKKMHIRTGGLCSPGGIASALSLQPWEVKRNFSAGFRCGTENDIVAGKPTGVIRASLGAMSTLSDVDRFVGFLKQFFQETDIKDTNALHHISKHGLVRSLPSLRVKAITIYPIKSCGGFEIPPGIRWEIRPEGLAWDREWCLVHQGSGQALSQKRCPKMALLRPSLDLDEGLLTVKFCGKVNIGQPGHITIPLSADPSQFSSNVDALHSRVCGDKVTAQRYTSSTINEFFSIVLGVPCILARLPPGGAGSSSRLSKAQVQTHQRPRRTRDLPGSFPEVPSPPSSDSEQQKPAKILLSNESPILLIYDASVRALNVEIGKSGGIPVNDHAFRANVVIENVPGQSEQPAFSEDEWNAVRIGAQDFQTLGACRRCQMVCIDQETGEKREEPYVTLARVRRFDGKVYFGVHMKHAPKTRGPNASKCLQYPTIVVGEDVSVEYQGQ